MKRFACLAVLLPLLLATVSGQVLFHDDFQDVNLNRFLVGDLDSNWTLYNDANKPSSSPDLTYFDQAWKVLRISNSEMAAASLSLFDGNKAADRWMVSPEIDLGEAKNPILHFRSKTLDANNRDGFEVRISTEGIEKESFKTVLESVSRDKSFWNQHQIDLSEYKGEKIHIAFIQNSKEQYIIAIDDIWVYDKEALAVFVDGFSAAFTVISDNDHSSVDATACLFNAGSESVTSYRLCTQTDNGEVRKTDVSDVELAAGDALNLSARFDLEKTGFHTLQMWVENINGKNVSSPRTNIRILSANNKKLPKKNLLLELFSSGMCTACAPWNKVLHELFVSDHANIADNSGNFCVAKYQVNIPSTGDPCVTEQSLARCSFYNVNAAPSFYMNGHFLPLGNYENVLQTIRNAIGETHKTTVSTGLTAYLEREGYTFKVHAEITGYLPDPENYNLLICLLEDSIHHLSSMHNGETDFYYVTRQMMTGVKGLALDACEIGETISKDFEYTFDQSSPKIFSSLENTNAVIFLQNRKTNDIIQARYLAQGYKDQSIIVNNRPLETQRQQLRVYPNPAWEYCRVAFTAPTRVQARLELVDMQGKTVMSRNITLEAGENQFDMDLQPFAAGLYFVRLTSTQGVFVHKLMKR